MEMVQKSGSVLRPGQIAPIPPMDPSAPGICAADVPVNVPPDDPSNGFETAAAQLHPNKVDISRHLFQLFSPAFVKKYPDARVEIAYANMAGSEKPDEAETFSAFDLQKAADFAEMKSKTGFNIYVGAALRRDECRGRADGGDFVDASRAWADFDKHGDDARVDLLLKEKNLQPSEIVQTGSTPHRRFQIYLRHADSVTEEQSRDANTALKTWLGGDKVQSPVHLMRLAGSINYPSKKKREERGYVAELVQLHVRPDAPAYTVEQLTGAAPRRQGYGETPETPAPTVESFFKEVNQLALLRLSTWVKPLFGEKVKFYSSNGTWRITSKDLGRNLEEDLSISQRGVWDYGTEQASSPIQLVMQYGPRKALLETTVADAALWLCKQMGIAPEALGWGTRERRSADDAGHAGGHDFNKSAGQDGQPSIRATPYVWRDPKDIPKREFLYGTHLIRKFGSAKFAAGGVGKSALALTEAIAIASNRPLLGIVPRRRCRVWYWNGEDPKEETERRIAAICRHHGITAEEIEGWLFYDSGRDQPIVIAEQTKTGSVIAKPVVKALTDPILDEKIDVLIVDPFVSCHRIVENDNPAMDMVAKQWTAIADETNTAIELIHHTKKTGGADATVEDGRGAVALLAAVRSAQVLNKMTSDEGAKAGVDNHRQYFKVENGKANLAPPPEGKDWFRIVGVPLGNGDGVLVPGDNVGVVTAWKWPDPLDGVTGKHFDLAAAAIRTGRWKESVQAKDWVGWPIAKALGLDLHGSKSEKAKVKGLIKIWISQGSLVVVEEKDDHRELKSFVRVADDA
jgi:AAA domain